MAKNAIETVAREDKVCTLMPHASLKRFGTEIAREFHLDEETVAK